MDGSFRAAARQQTGSATSTTLAISRSGGPHGNQAQITIAGPDPSPIGPVATQMLEIADLARVAYPGRHELQRPG
jgi:hypothetical protein